MFFQGVLPCNVSVNVDNPAKKIQLSRATNSNATYPPKNSFFL